MMKNTAKYLSIGLMLLLGVMSCKQDDVFDDNPGGNGDPTSPNNWVYNPTFYVFETPKGFPPPNLPADNQLTNQGIKLGRMLFYDPILSGDSTLSCAGCHNQQFAFSDNGRRFSTGITQEVGKRNSMPIFNLAWSDKFFWDGRASNLTDQAQMPVVDPIEMHASWSENLDKLRAHADYPRLFFEAFEVLPEDITPTYTGKALAQFMFTIVSADSKFDKDFRGESGGDPSKELTAQEWRGAQLFEDFNGADCLHCHGAAGVNGTGGNILFMNLDPTRQFVNNGLQNAPGVNDFADKGSGETTGNTADNGKFKIPSLRNLAFTAPYMHDGRFQTLEEVIDFYSTGVHQSANIDPGMEFASTGGVDLTDQEKEDLLAFLMTLNDYDFLTNPEYSNPFE